MTIALRCASSLTLGAGPLRSAAKRLGLLILAGGMLASAAGRAAATTPPASVDTLRPPPDARLYLTWHAPFGQPGATDQLMAACGDTTAKDTLYMCFDPGRDAEHFQSFTATVYFWAATGDTLDPHLSFGEGRDIKRLQVQFAPDSVAGAQPAWPTSAFAAAGYNATAGSGKLRMIAAGPKGSGGWPLEAGSPYVAARLLVPRPSVKGRACDRPICIEWAFALLGYGDKSLPEIHSGQRFVSWNSPGGKACAPMRSFAAPQPWQPKRQLPPGYKGH
jgi:hypothetical protein